MALPNNGLFGAIAGKKSLPQLRLQALLGEARKFLQAMK